MDVKLAMKKQPTMRDVADLVGVSTQTVSAVVNGKPGITAETSARVQAAIAQLGYHPYSVARSLRTRQTRTIALIVSDIANPSFATIASAAEDHAHEYGYSLLVYNTHDSSEREESYVRTATQRWIDGVLFVSAEDRMTGLDAFEAANIPAVAIDRVPEHFDGPSVTLDNMKAGRLAADHLLDLGHTRIAHISGPLKLRLARERMAGFVQAIEARGITPLPYPAGEGDWTCESGYQIMSRILATGERPSAVFAASDRLAIGAIQAAFQRGLQVPDDLSVIGLDDIETAAYQVPPLTTVRQSFVDLGTRAVRLLLELIEFKHVPQGHIVIEPVLVTRQSTARLVKQSREKRR